MPTRVAHGALLSLAVITASAGAHAQTLSDANAAARRQLIEQAQQSRDHGNHAEALELASRAGRLQMSPSLRRFIAEEQNALGQPAEALRSAILCVDEAQHDTTPGRNSRPHGAACQALIDSLRSRVGRVIVRVASAPPAGSHILVAGMDLPEALWGIAYEVDPGTVVVEAQSNGQTIRREVRVAMGDVEPVTVSFPAGAAPTVDATPSQPARTEPAHTTRTETSRPTRNEPARTEPARTQPAPVEPARTEPVRAAQPTPAPAQPVSAEPEPAREHSLGPYVVLGGAAVSFIAAGVFYAVRNGYRSQWQSMCEMRDGMYVNCPDTGRPAYQNEVTWNAATDVALVVGALAFAGGAAWFAVDRLGGRPAPRATAFVAPSTTGLVLGIQGGF